MSLAYNRVSSASLSFSIAFADGDVSIPYTGVSIAYITVSMAYCSLSIAFA